MATTGSIPFASAVEGAIAASSRSPALSGGSGALGFAPESAPGGGGGDPGGGGGSSSPATLALASAPRIPSANFFSGTAPRDLPRALCAGIRYDMARIFCAPTRVAIIENSIPPATPKRKIRLGGQSWIQFYSNVPVTVMRNGRFHAEIPPLRYGIHTFWEPDGQEAEFDLVADYVQQQAGITVPLNTSAVDGLSSPTPNTIGSPVLNDQDYLVDTDIYTKSLMSIYGDPETPLTFNWYIRPTSLLHGPVYVRLATSKNDPVLMSLAPAEGRRNVLK